MFWRITLVALKAIGILGVINLTPAQRQALHLYVPTACAQYGQPGKAPAVEQVNFAPECDSVNRFTVIDSEKSKKSGEFISSVKAGVLQFLDCLGEYFDYESMKYEAMIALANGTMDPFMRKYCGKAPLVKKCVLEGLTNVNPCIPRILRVGPDIQINATDSVLQWICTDKGDKASLFITDNGQQCIANSMEPIRECTLSLKASFIEDLSLKVKCTRFEEMSNCVVAALLYCDSRISALIINSIFGYIRDVSPCKEFLRPFKNLKG